MGFDGVVILGKELRQDPARAIRELRARAAAGSAASRAHAAPVLSMEASLRGQDRAGSALVGDFLDTLGVSADRQLLLQVSRSTREELLVARRVADARGWRRVLVVTSSYHVPRARSEAEEVFGRDRVAVHAPESMLKSANSTERTWIHQGTPDAATRRIEGRIEQRLRVLNTLGRALPRSLHWRLELLAAGLLRSAGT